MQCYDEFQWEVTLRPSVASSRKSTAENNPWLQKRSAAHAALISAQLPAMAAMAMHILPMNMLDSFIRHHMRLSSKVVLAQTGESIYAAAVQNGGQPSYLT